MMADKGKILIYTRIPDGEMYPTSLASSIHLAYCIDGKNYVPLNQNYGILFAAATISPENTIQEKRLQFPCVFSGEDDSYTIVAERIDGKSNKSDGTLLEWTTRDFIHFSEGRIINQEEADKNTEVIRLYKEFLETDKKRDEINLTGIVPGNTLEIESQQGNRIYSYWLPVENTSVKVPDRIKVRALEDIQSVKAEAGYSDGSIAIKAVAWDTSTVDFTKSGTYQVHGRVKQKKYQFPLAMGFADPAIVRWKDKYYFISTNDNTNAVGISVREADTPEGLFQAGVKEGMILDYDKKRHLIQTFWAPELHVIGDEVYMLFAVGAEVWGPQSNVMKLKSGGNILDPGDWEDPIRVMKMDGSNLTDDGITLDMTYFKVKKTSYMVWSYRYGLGTQKDTGSMLYIATIDEKEPWKLTSEPVLLSRPLFGWENVQGTVNNEGPYALFTDDKIFLTYSGGAANDYSYAIGLLSIPLDGDLLNPKQWTKSCTPKLSWRSLNGEYGPGHNSFFVDDNGDVMIVYHAQEKPGSLRCSGIRRVHFNAEGEPVLNMSVQRDLNDEIADVVMEVVVDEKSIH